MPNYGVAQTVSPGGNQLTVLLPGEQFVLFNAESPTAPQASVAFARGFSVGGPYTPITFTIHFASAPTDSLLIQGSNVDVDAQYQTVATSTNKQDDFYTDINCFLFYRAKLNTGSAGGALTVIASR